MANAVASSSRDRPARNRGSVHSLNQYSPREGVIITNEITHSARPTHVRNDTVKIINQYELKRKVGKGQHGEVYLAEDTGKMNKPVVRSLPPFPSIMRLKLHPRFVRVMFRPSSPSAGRTRATGSTSSGASTRTSLALRKHPSLTSSAAQSIRFARRSRS